MVHERKEVPETDPLSFKNADLDLCFNRIRKELVMPDENLHFLRADNLEEYKKSYDIARCLIMQGGQGEVKHWAFNDPVKRKGAYKDNPPTPEEYRQLTTRIVDLHPLTIIQNARTSGEAQYRIFLLRPYQSVLQKHGNLKKCLSGMPVITITRLASG